MTHLNKLPHQKEKYGGSPNTERCSKSRAAILSVLLSSSNAVTERLLPCSGKGSSGLKARRIRKSEYYAHLGKKNATSNQAHLHFLITL